MKFKTKYLTRFLLLFLVADLFLYLWPRRQAFLTPYDPLFWQAKYEDSQWVKGFGAGYQMGDADLYAYAGWRQVQGDDPASINPEQPPIGKYLLGLSILVFRNQNLISLFLGLLELGLLFLFGRLFLKNDLGAAFLVLLVGTEPLFQENLITSMLDLPFLLFLTLAFHLLLQTQKKPSLFPPALFFLSLAAMTKIYLAGLGLTVAIGLLIGFLVWRKKKIDYHFFLFSLPLVPLVWLASYFIFFFQGKTIFDFKYLLFWVQHFARVRVVNYPPGQIFNIFLFGRWQTWWGQSRVLAVESWRFFWPASFIAGLVFTWRSWLSLNYQRLLIALWGFGLLLMYALGVPYPRYLLAVFPPFYLMFLSLFFLKPEQK